MRACLCGFGPSVRDSQVAPGPPEEAPEPSTSAAAPLTTDAVLLGLSGAGKTLLIRQLMHIMQPKKHDPPNAASIIKTIGLDYREIKYHRRTVTMREVGGPMQPIWHQFVSDCRAVVFVVDASDPPSFEKAAEGLKTVAAFPGLPVSSRLLVLLNKADQPGALTQSDAESRLGLPSSSGRTPAVMVASADSLDQCREVLNWVLEGLAPGPAKERPKSERKKRKGSKMKKAKRNAVQPEPQGPAAAGDGLNGKREGSGSEGGGKAGSGTGGSGRTAVAGEKQSPTAAAEKTRPVQPDSPPDPLAKEL